ncbi:MAG: hypothetical protein J6T10_00080 [Methanobrevibacter sp.]|nr:hypothetical protein [Methanobrevibacter sp.]
MTSQELKDKLSVEDVIKYVTEFLGSDEPEYDPNGNPIFQTICHNPAHCGKHKLFYYVESKQFHCYTECAENFDIFSLTCKSKGYDPVSEFRKAFVDVQNFFNLGGVQFGFGNETKEELSDGWTILQKFKDFNAPKKELQPLPKVQENILEYFGPTVAPAEWLKEGISADAMAHYGIRIDSAMRKIIIPHRDIDGNLCGIRGRSFDPDEVADGKKYMPVYIQKDCYKHPLGQNLYGLYENQDVIRRLKKVAVFEGEKSVLLCATYYNRYIEKQDPNTGEVKYEYENNNFAVATCGSSFSTQQLKLLLNLGVNEIIFCYDKENDDDKESELTQNYEEKLLKITKPLTKYANIYVVMDYEGLLGYKDSPADKGKETLEKLMKKKQQVSAVEADTERKRRLN